MSQAGDLLLSFYGDDFTGSTDVMEALTMGGLPTALFLEPPTPSQLVGRFAKLGAVGVAGVSRSMTPVQMEQELVPKFKALKQLSTPFFHYKVCSTFDSSPTIGSIGHAIDIGCRIFEPTIVPLVVGAPALNRFVAFGNLFARVHDTTYRLDRHPTMSKHPVTPMDESDLQIHLSKQTTRSMAIIDLLQLADADQVIDKRLQALIDSGTEIVLFDTVDNTHLLKIGRLIWAQRGEKTALLVGSSGIEYALTAYLQSAGIIRKPPPLVSPGAVDRLLVISGSAAPGTAEQISFALDHGFRGLRLDAARLINPQTADAERELVIAQALMMLDSGSGLILYSTHGPDDPAISTTTTSMAGIGLEASHIGEYLGKQQGLILRALLERTALTRVCVAGGDTCGHTLLQLGIYALEILTPIAPGAPLCRASSHHPRFNGLQISLKGGQNGTADYFVNVLRGGT